MSCDLSICARLPLTPHPAVLVVDDDAAYLQAMPPTLVRKFPDAVVETCSSAREATAKLVDGHYDVAIADLTMPELDGFAVLAETLAVRPCTSVLLVTGKKDAALAERGFRQGAFDFVAKPFDLQRLLWSVQLGIKAHRFRRRIEERRLYMMQIQEVAHRRWEEPLFAKPGDAVNSRSLMDAAYDRLIASATRTEKLIQRTERVLRRMQHQVHKQALSRVRDQRV